MILLTRDGVLTSAALLRPAARAYSLAYASVIGPRLLRLSIALYRRGRSSQTPLRCVYRIFLDALVFHGFPSFSGLLVGLSTLLQLLLKLSLNRLAPWQRHWRAETLAIRFLGTLMAAWSSFQILQTSGQIIPRSTESQKAKGEARQISADTLVDNDQESAANPCQKRPAAIAGRTIDLTLFAVIRALDSSLSLLWSQSQHTWSARGNRRAIMKHLSGCADVALFVGTAGVVMDSWFYRPDTLPRSYREWIWSAAQVDERLVQALRQARRGDFMYGKKSKTVSTLQSMCEDYRLPLKWSDPATTIPIPCELVHMGAGPSCHWHALSRLARAFKFALAMYLPLHLLLLLRRPSRAAMLGASKAALRSSMFLASFVSLFYYGVCLSRTLVGPKIFSSKVISPMMWDQGLCVRAGCLLCGWSIFIESKQRRQEIALFVAPRAAATLIPRRYDAKLFWRERAAFSLSVALLFTLAYEDPRLVRGMLGTGTDPKHIEPASHAMPACQSILTRRLIPPPSTRNRHAVRRSFAQCSRSVCFNEAAIQSYQQPILQQPCRWQKTRPSSQQRSFRQQALTTLNQFKHPYSNKNRSTMFYTLSIILGTVALSYGSVPMYKMICQQTGWGGQPIKASIHSSAEDPASRLQPVTSSRRLRITFNGSVSDIMPWKFTPQQREVRVLPGETALAFFTATNKSDEDIIGVATYSVTPGQVAPYFSKIQCFCFEEQRLNAGETVDMPVFFFIDPDFVNDPTMNKIDTITLSYTFFKARYDKNGRLTPMPMSMG